MKWGKLTTPPGFTIAASGSLDTSEDSSTIEYQGTVYDIQSAKITAPSHKTWIVPDKNTDLNTLDLFITFQSRDSTSTTKYIFVVLPLINDVNAKNPSYLGRLAGDKVDNKDIPGPFSFEDVLPLAGNRNYAYYSTSFTVTESSLTKSALTLVFYNGRTVMPSTLNALNIIANFEGTNTFPAYTLPIELTASTDKTISSFPSGAGVSTYTTPLANRTDLTKAYNCVPLDPDTDIKDGKIQFDATSSEIVPLNKIIDERDKVRLNELEGQISKKGSVEQVIAVFLGILLSLTVLVLLFFIFSQSMGWAIGLPAVPTYFYVGVGACFLGYMIGTLYHA